MVITTNTQTNRTITLVSKLCIRNRIEIEVDNVVKCTNNSCNLFFHLLFVLQWESTKWKTCQVTYDKLTWTSSCYNNSITILCFYFLRYSLNWSHVLSNLSTEIRAVNHTLMSVRISSVYSVTVEGKWCSGLNSRTKNKTNDILNADYTTWKTLIINTIKILTFPLLAVTILKAITLYTHNFIRTEEWPVLIHIFLCHLPE